MSKRGGKAPAADPPAAKKAAVAPPVADPRAALAAAIATLPIDGEFDVPQATLAAAGLENDAATARKYVVSFATWAREAIARLPPAPASEMEATDFNDYYKVVMSRVQYLYTQAAGGLAPGTAPEMPLCCFQTQLRRRPHFAQAGAPACSCVFDLKGRYAPKAGVTAVSSLEESEAAFRQALTAAGARKFTAATLRALVASPSPKAAPIESSLAPINEELSGAVCGPNALAAP